METMRRIENEMPPFGKARPRVTRDGTRTYMPTEYQNKREQLRLMYQAAGGKSNPTEPIFLDLIFSFRMPKSWSKKKRKEMDWSYCQKTPDIDNLVGGVMDALIEKDQLVVTLRANKFWRDKDLISIRMEYV